MVMHNQHHSAYSWSTKHCRSGNILPDAEQEVKSFFSLFLLASISEETVSIYVWGRKTPKDPTWAASNNHLTLELSQWWYHTGLQKTRDHWPEDGLSLSLCPLLEILTTILVPNTFLFSEGCLLRLRHREHIKSLLSFQKNELMSLDIRFFFWRSPKNCSKIVLVYCCKNTFKRETKQKWKLNYFR